MALDVEAARADFPILSRQVHGKPLVYLDSAASAQKPRAVIEVMTRAMEHSYANVHRGLHTLANETTEAYEAARKAAARLLNADVGEIVFTKGATEAINLVAAGLSQRLKAGDEVLITEMEHHANIVPWHFLRERQGVALKVAPLTADGRLDAEGFTAPLAADVGEIVFTTGATEGINLVAAGLSQRLKAGDEVLITEMEHHANIVPWHFLRERQGVVLKFAPITDDGRLDVEGFRALLTDR